MTTQQPYAPIPRSYLPTSLSASINPDEEVVLASTRSERDLHESLAEVYSIVVTLDELERAYLKDATTEAEYTEACDRLLKQYRAVLDDEAVRRAFGDLEAFKARWDMEVPRATERLRVGMPSTVVSATSYSTGGGTGDGSGVGGKPATGAGSGASGSLILEATQDFITFLDALKLGLLAKDQLHPALSDVIQSVNKVTDGADFEGRARIVQWLIKLNGMKASEELSEDQARELELDMNMAYHGFKATLT